MRAIFNTMLFSAASVTLTAGLTASADPSVASVPQPVTAQVRVAYDDLNLQKAAGRATLDPRIASAARRICTTDETSDRLDGRACRRLAIETAHRDLDARTTEAGSPAAN